MSSSQKTEDLPQIRGDEGDIMTKCSVKSQIPGRKKSPLWKNW